MKRFQDYHTIKDEYCSDMESAKINMLNDLAESVERLEKKVKERHYNKFGLEDEFRKDCKCKICKE